MLGCMFAAPIPGAARLFFDSWGHCQHRAARQFIKAEANRACSPTRIFPRFGSKLESILISVPFLSMFISGFPKRSRRRLTNLRIVRYRFLSRASSRSQGTEPAPEGRAVTYPGRVRAFEPSALGRCSHARRAPSASRAQSLPFAPCPRYAKAPHGRLLDPSCAPAGLNS